MEFDRWDERLIGILNDGFGHKRSREEQFCYDAEGRFIPWYTYPAIEYIDDLDFSEKTVFEYGSGASSIFWAERVKSITSVEADEEWYNKIKPDIRQNQNLILQKEQDKYVKEILKYDKFDIVIIDGHARRQCAELMPQALNTAGLVILDNSDWYIDAGLELQKQDFIQADMKGFGPINPYCWVTSFFYDREFRSVPKNQYHPSHGIGGRDIIVNE